MSATSASPASPGLAWSLSSPASLTTHDREVQPPGQARPDIASPGHHQISGGQNISSQQSHTPTPRASGQGTPAWLCVGSLTSWGDDGWPGTMTSHHQHMTTDNTQHQPSPPLPSPANLMFIPRTSWLIYHCVRILCVTVNHITLPVGP